MKPAIDDGILQPKPHLTGPTTVFGLANCLARLAIFGYLDLRLAADLHTPPLQPGRPGLVGPYAPVP